MAAVHNGDKHHFTPLMNAARQGLMDQAKTLIEQGAEVNARNDKGWTPLMCAAWKGHQVRASELSDV